MATETRTRDARNEVTATGALPRSLAARIRVGITGHRELRDAALVAQQLAEVLDELPRRVSPSGLTPIRFTAVSPLAEGADRLLARAVLATPGGRLWAPLPLPLASNPDARRLPATSYDIDFRENRDEFYDLLAQASWSEVVATSTDRPQAYEDVGRFVVTECDVLIAVWDGKEAKGAGGTGEIVRLAIDGGVPYVIVPPDGSPPTWHLRGWRGHVAEVDHLNALQVPDHESVIAAERSHRMPGVGNLVDHPRLIACCDWALPHYVRADQSAAHHQTAFRRAGVVLAALAVLAVTLATLHALCFDEVWELPIVESLCIALGVAVVVAGTRLKVSRRWLWARTLAERLRSAYFLAVVGCDEEIVDGPQPATDDERWVVEAANDIWLARPRHRGGTGGVDALRGYVLARWIEDQEQYYQEAAERSEANDRWIRRIVWTAILLAFAAALFEAIDHGPHGKALATAVAILAPAWGAAFAAVGEQREWRRHAHSYKSMQLRLAGLRPAFDDVRTLQDLQAAALVADKVLRTENADWFGYMQTRDLDPVP